MDFVSSIIKNKFKNEPKDDETSNEPEKKHESSSSNIGFIEELQHMFKNTFKSENESSDKKQLGPGDATETRKKGSLTSGFIHNNWLNSLFSDSKKERDVDTSAVAEGKSEPKVCQESSLDENAESSSKISSTENVSQKTIDSAKSFGNFLHSVANKASQTVSATAKHLKQTVEHNSLLADFTKEQQEFIKEHGSHLKAAEPPWVGCEDEEEVKKQIISLSQDRRSFVRNPPRGVEFDFDLQKMLPVALALLKHDPNLERMRFEIVPKLVNEENFWRNYFYRVSIVKQSSSLSKGCKGWASSSSSSAEGPDELSPTTTEPEFVSDCIQGSVTPEDLQTGMRQLGMDKSKSTSKDDTYWEDELNKDLQEFEVVTNDMSNEMDKDLDKELDQLDQL